MARCLLASNSRTFASRTATLLRSHARFLTISSLVPITRSANFAEPSQIPKVPPGAKARVASLSPPGRRLDFSIMELLEQSVEFVAGLRDDDAEILDGPIKSSDGFGADSHRCLWRGLLSRRPRRRDVREFSHKLCTHYVPRQSRCLREVA